MENTWVGKHKPSPPPPCPSLEQSPGSSRKPRTPLVMVKTGRPRGCGWRSETSQEGMSGRSERADPVGTLSTGHTHEGRKKQLPALPVTEHRTAAVGRSIETARQERGENEPPGSRRGLWADATCRAAPGACFTTGARNAEMRGHSHSVRAHPCASNVQATDPGSS